MEIKLKKAKADSRWHKKQITMKTKRKIVIIALLTMMYAYGGNAVNNAEKQEKSVKTSMDNELLRTVFDTIQSSNIHIVKYKGTLDENPITFEFHSLSDGESYSLYMYDKYNTPILLKKDNSVRYLKLDEQFPNKKGEGYLQGGKVVFRQHQKPAFELEGEYINPKGTKTYPVHLQATEIILASTKGDFEVLQEYSTKEHYFAILVGEFKNYFYGEISSSKIIVYDKKNGKKIQYLPFYKADYGNYFGTTNCIKPTNTKLNGIQIGYTPIDGNDNRDSACEAFLYKNGKYEKDTLLSNIETSQSSLYKGYNENGDISVIERSHLFSHHYTIPVTNGIESHYEYIMDYTSGVEIEEIYDKNCQCIVRTLNDVTGKYKTITKTDAKTGESLSQEVITNYSKEDYKISADGKILLKCNIEYGIFDLNGQDDLRAVEKIADSAFDIDLDRDYEEPGNSLSIILNENFKSIPESIKKHPNLAKVTELVVENSQPYTSTADLYTYFSKEEIRKNMDKTANFLSKDDYPFYANLLIEEGFTSSDKLEKMWGKAAHKNKENIKLDYGDGLVYDKMVLAMQFNQFKITLENCLEDFPEDGWSISELKTQTSGFGFGGVYVGVPECNKAYLLKLFEKFEIEENEFNGIKSLRIILNSDFYTCITVELDENELVKSATYYAHICAD